MTMAPERAPAESRRHLHETLERTREIDGERTKLEAVREALISDERCLVLAVAEARRECGELMGKLEEQSQRCSDIDAEIEQAKLEREGMRWEAALLQRRLRNTSLEIEMLESETGTLRRQLTAERASYEKAVLDIFRLEQQLRRRG